jgi:hypothetical protein
MKTAKEIIETLSKYPEDLKWYLVMDEDEGPLLVSEWTGDIADAQGCIGLGCELLPENQKLVKSVKLGNGLVWLGNKEHAITIARSFGIIQDIDGQRVTIHKATIEINKPETSSNA